MGFGYRFSLATMARAMWSTQYLATASRIVAGPSIQHISASVSFDGSGQGDATISSIDTAKSTIIMHTAEFGDSIRWKFQSNVTVRFNAGSGLFSTSRTINFDVLTWP